MFQLPTVFRLTGCPLVGLGLLQPQASLWFVSFWLPLFPIGFHTRLMRQHAVSHSCPCVFVPPGWGHVTAHSKTYPRLGLRPVAHRKNFQTFGQTLGSVSTYSRLFNKCMCRCLAMCMVMRMSMCKCMCLCRRVCMQ